MFFFIFRGLNSIFFLLVRMGFCQWDGWLQRRWLLSWGSWWTWSSCFLARGSTSLTASVVVCSPAGVCLVPPNTAPWTEVLASVTCWNCSYEFRRSWWESNQHQGWLGWSHSPGSGATSHCQCGSRKKVWNVDPWGCLWRHSCSCLNCVDR